MKLKFVLLLFATVLVEVGAQNDAVDTVVHNLQKALDARIEHKGKQPVHNIALSVHHQDYLHTVGAGTNGLKSRIQIKGDEQFRIASITKTFVAVIIMQLAEEGLLGLDDHALSHISDLDFLRFEEMHCPTTDCQSHEIQIRHLLNHTSGLADIFTDAENRFLLSVLVHRRRHHSLEMIVDRFFKYKLNERPAHSPGAGYHYSDMNFMVLGLLAEAVTNQSLPMLIRKRILEPLDLSDTYFEYREPACGHGREVNAFFRRLNLTEKINTSYEWGGGGLVSTTPDLVRFIQGLFSGTLIQANSLDQMISLEETNKFGESAGFGVFRYDLAGITFFGHGGAYGSLLLHTPDEDMTIAINVGQMNIPFDEKVFLEEIINIVKK